MRIARIRLHPYSLPLVRPWVAASATITRRAGALVSVTTVCGTTGWGDCAPLPSTRTRDLRVVIATLHHAAERLSGLDAEDALAALDGETVPEVRWALETALRDAMARAIDIPLAKYLESGARSTVAVNAALGPLDERCIDRAHRALADGYAVAKIKVGVGSIDREIAALGEIAAATGGRLRLRLDANRAWDVGEAERLLGAISGLPIDGVEEPLKAPTPDSLALLQAAVPFALAVDESLPAIGLEALLEKRAVRRLVVKPARLGGMKRVLGLAGACAAADVELVLTSVVDTAIGVIATASLAAALPRQAVHGLATSAWLDADVALAPEIVAGELRLPSGPGLGREPGREYAQS